MVVLRKSGDEETRMIDDVERKKEFVKKSDYWCGVNKARSTPPNTTTSRF